MQGASTWAAAASRLWPVIDQWDQVVLRTRCQQLDLGLTRLRHPRPRAATAEGVDPRIKQSSRRQGAVGIGRAIAYFTAKGYSVFIPVADVNRYDLLVDTGGEILRIEVKTTRQVRGNVTLRTMGGYHGGGKERRLSSADCDIVFVVDVLTGQEREFPIKDLEGRNTVNLGRMTE